MWFFKFLKIINHIIRIWAIRRFSAVPSVWIEEDITEKGFSIYDRSSIEKLIGYIKANEALLDTDILYTDYTSAILTNDEATTKLIREILLSEKNKEALYELFKEQYPELDKKILTYKLVQARKAALYEFE